MVRRACLEPLDLPAFFVRLNGLQLGHKPIVFLVKRVQGYTQCYRCLTNQYIQQTRIVTQMILRENLEGSVAIRR